MKLEAITTCVDYGDLLAWTLPFILRQFDRLVVMTTPEDKRTHDLCEFHHVECVETTAFHRDEKAFDKGAAINEGLKHLAADDWVCHLDADILLPPRTRDILERLDLDQACLYGVDRMMCQGFAAFAHYIMNPEVQHSCDIYVQGTAFPLGTRIARLRGDGYMPLGFFQLWNARVSGVRSYPSHGAADRSDLLFAQQWKRHQRHSLPEIIAVHLANDEGEDKMGVNWRGRRSKQFCDYGGTKD